MNALRLGMLLAAAALLVSCDDAGPAHQTCNADSCTGCCDPSGQCQPGGVPQACGGNGAACVACAGGMTCQFSVCTSGGGCIPKSCAELGRNCGQSDDGCGGQLACGVCGEGESCGGGGAANVCGVGTCTARTCLELGANCGQPSDGCDLLLNCGTCAGNQTCGGGGTPNLCGVPSCQAKTCAELEKNCGIVSDGCSGQVNCGSCSAPEESCGGGGVFNVCGKETCAPKSCAQLGKECGAVGDSCGNAVNCGSCSQPLSCGGSGVANLCGAACAMGCPAGFTCTQHGVCEGTAPTGLVLDVVHTSKVAVSGNILLNGAAPALNCTTASPARLSFVSATGTHYDHALDILCNASFAFSTQLYPGTYEVWVRGTPAGNLPPWNVQVNPALTVTSATSGLVLDVIQPPRVTVSGSIKLNGGSPTLSCTNTSPATVKFTSATEPNHDQTVNLLCNASFAFSAQLYPGTYEVSVTGTQYSNLPEWKMIVMAALQVTAATSGLVLDVIQAPKVAFSGSVKLNGATPVLGACVTAAPANVLLVSAANPEHRHAFSLPCDASFNFSTQVFPGTYSVWVGGTQWSNIPNFYANVNPALTVTSATSGVVLNVIQWEVSGSIKLNGGAPTLACTTGSPATVLFVSATSPNHDRSVNIPCNASFAFSAGLNPGTYEVRVRGTQYANLPQWSVKVNPALSVTSALSGVVLDVIQPPKVAVSGSIKLNGGTPTKSCTSTTTSPATINFVSASEPNHNVSLSIPCDESFAFGTDLYPGSYSVSVRGNQYSNLPIFNFKVTPALAVSAATSGLLLNVVQAPRVPVSGIVQLNGAPPISTCTTASLASVIFKSASDPDHTQTIAVPCDPSFAFSGQVYPGTYTVSVRGTALSNLPQWAVPVVEQLKLPAGDDGARTVVISQVYGGGGEAGASYTNDFIELFNPGPAAVSLAGWSLQYAAAAETSWQVTPLSGFIGAGRYLLVEQAAGAGGTLPLPKPDVVGSIGMSPTAGKVVLVKNAIPLLGACPKGPHLVDLVGFGGTGCFEGSGPAAAPGVADAVLRKKSGCEDSADNAADFLIGAPGPRNSAAFALACN